MKFNLLLKLLGYEKNKILDLLLDYFNKKECILDLLERFLMEGSSSIRFYINEEQGITFFDEENVGSVSYSWVEEDNWIIFSGDEACMDEDSYLLYKSLIPILDKFYKEIYLKCFY